MISGNVNDLANYEVLVRHNQQQSVSLPLSSIAATKGTAELSIPLLCADLNGCPSLPLKAVEEVLRLIDDNLVVRVNASSFFGGGIDTEEQLDHDLSGLKERCLALIGAGKKVLVQ